MKKIVKLSSVVVGLLIATSVVHASDMPKQALKTNFQLIYQKQKSVDTIADMFREGRVYGRLRSHTFLNRWERDNTSQNSHFITGIGASLVYKSATYANIDMTGGLYYSRAFFDETSDPEDRLKMGADLISRYNSVKYGEKYMAVVGQAYVSYKGLPKTEIHVGRQLVETFYTKSNDSKMIPNSFDGVVLETKYFPNTSVKLAYLTDQKLRAHTHNHSVLAYADGTTPDSWGQNDDSAMHKGLTVSALGAKYDRALITGDIQNTTVENLKLQGSFYNVPDLLSETMLEANYKIPMYGASLTPGIRYIKQFDNGAGAIGGAAYDIDVTGYKDPNSLDSQMLALRLVAAHKGYTLNLGFSHVFDEADLVAPWRGFPTAGYTRSMARYNWRANTTSYRIQLTHGANQSGVYKELFTQFSVLHTNADETKKDADETYYYAGFVQNLPMMPQLQWRLRLGYADTEKKDADNFDGRFELNYLF